MILNWISNDQRDGEYAETGDGYFVGWRKMGGVALDGYLAEVCAPKWTYTGRFETKASAKSWAGHIIARDRKAPLCR
jgi:hypothetical protein